jgi:GNAT superfamily N-acetyltransferase
MERCGLLHSGADAADGRRRMLELSREGRAMMQRIAPVWGAVRECTREVIASSGIDMLAGLDAVERELDEQEMYTRVRHALRHVELTTEIVGSKSVPKRHFERLNREWLGKVLPLEPHDRRLLRSPETEIIAEGGEILYARKGRQVVGTAAILRQDPGVYEIAKMAVTQRARGHGIGRLLAESCITWAKKKKAREIRIATSPKLRAALSLYRSMGFVEVKPDKAWRDEYRRKTVFMKLGTGLRQ